MTLNYFFLNNQNRTVTRFTIWLNTQLIFAQRRSFELFSWKEITFIEWFISTNLGMMIQRLSLEDLAVYFRRSKLTKVWQNVLTALIKPNSPEQISFRFYQILFSLLVTLVWKEVTKGESKWKKAILRYNLSLLFFFIFSVNCFRLMFSTSDEQQQYQHYKIYIYNLIKTRTKYRRTCAIISHKI